MCGRGPKTCSREASELQAMLPLAAVFQIGTAAASGVKIQETLIFRAQLASVILQANVRRLGALPMSPIERQRLALHDAVCMPTILDLRTRQPCRRCRWRANQAPRRSRCRFLDTHRNSGA